MTKVQGDKDSAFTYTGHFWHAQSGLNLTYYRAYDPNLGRWLSRDPIGERGGVNLYGYVGNEVVNAIDPTGLQQVYGNWCGPNWTGGRVEEYTPANDGFYLPPIDSLDAACKRHDICYYKCRKKNGCNEEKKSSCFLKCDLSLIGSATGIGPWNYSGYIIAAGMMVQAANNGWSSVPNADTSDQITRSGIPITSWN